ncbi:methylated-DNA--[protein]-cysteine S-methyltransferase [Yinghuangia soli]|uniref:methylated-DNA--[protein]-cysteine S-methyltransferase n=1 Tax=Yinghuangia soli TaxID=2908204 RepID=A0AA41PXK6_9ACTN|nr:methylated-DNA--[protein]-cysteine S-methyltransferase [Yinghuangia soli]MCF2527704.1 methylated-DNA--[protein]-cysteine S-methyltransferase [Yinghuangia soli]
MTTVHTSVPSPVGELLLVGRDAAGGTVLTSVSTPGAKNAPVPQASWRRAPAAFAAAAEQLEAYFAGERTVFDLAFDAPGSDFQVRAWRALEEIPYGTTTTYGALATRLGLPRERVQALGGAIGANPLLIVRPCHRVIGADGTMRGYAGGVERKHRLLVHEGALQPTLV